MKRAAAIFPVLFAMGLAGCQQCPPAAVSIQRLVGEYNANAAAVPRLWAMARIRVTLIDPGSGLPFTWDTGDATSVLLLSKGPKKLGPHDFVLIGRELGADLFRLGSDAESGVYYMWYKFGDEAGAWWGRHEFAGAPGVTLLPMDPNQLLAVLGVCELPEQLDRLPAVAMRMNTEGGKCAYVVSYIDRQSVSGRILFKRQVYFEWDKKRPRRPFRIDFLDAAGMRVVTAELKDYRPIDLTDGGPASKKPTSGQAMMPTDIRLTRIDPKTHRETSSVHIWLSRMTTEDKWDRDAVKLNPPANVKMIQVDRNVKAGK